MAIPELSNYIKDARKAGMTRDQIHAELNKVGWKSEEIQEAFDEEMSEEKIKQKTSSYMPSRKLSVVENTVFPGGVRANIKPKRRFLWEKVVIALFIFLVLGGSAYGAYWYYGEVYLPDVFDEAVQNLRGAKTMHADLRIGVRADNFFSVNSAEKALSYVPSRGAALIGKTLSLLTGDKSSQESVSKGEYYFNLSIDADQNDLSNPKFKYVISLGNDSGFDIKADVRFIDKKLYAQLVSVPMLVLATAQMALPHDLKQPILKKWVSVDFDISKDDITAFIDKAGAEAGMSPGELEEFKLQFEQIYSSMDAGEIVRQQKDILALADKRDFFDIDKGAKREEIDGIGTYHFVVRLNKPEFISFYKEVLNTQMKKQFGVYDEKMTDEMFKEIEEPMTNIMPDYIDIWITRKDRNIYKISADLDIAKAIPEEISKDGEFMLNFEIKFTNIDKPINFEVPEVDYDLGTVLDVARYAVIDSLGNAGQKARDEKRVADVKQMQLALELYYDDKGGYPSKLKYLESKYISRVPTDPTTGKDYNYKRISLNDYLLSAKLENQDNSILQYDVNPGNALYEVKP